MEMEMGVMAVEKSTCNGHGKNANSGGYKIKENIRI